MSQRTGRKPSDNPKSIMFRMRIDKTTSEMLDYCAKRLGISKSEVIRRGIVKIRAEIEK